MSLTALIGTNGLPADSSIAFSVYGVKNPISVDTVAELSVGTTDSLGGYIDVSQISFQPLTPAPLTSPSFVPDSAVVQDITRYQVSFGIGVPL